MATAKRTKKKIQIINKSPHPLPCYSTEGAVGMDVRAFLLAPLTLAPLGRSLVPTGLYVAIPPGYEIQVRGRSGLSIRHGITVLNAPGTIDPDYRGELKVLLINLSQEAYTIENGDRIAQLICTSYVEAAWETVEKLPATSRGQGGFGSTGVK